MTIKSDKWIRRMAEEHGMISPFEPAQVRCRLEVSSTPQPQASRVISFGCSSYGYDLRLSDVYKVFTNVHTTIIDPKDFDERAFVEVRGPHCIIPPNSFALAVSLERLRIPRRVTGIVLGKSTYARCGIIVCCTPAEAGWAGHLTIEISNTTPLPARVYSREGICQVLFLESDEDCAVSYADRGGKYQDQVALPTLPRL